jgi:SHS2 domain-containing protein
MPFEELSHTGDIQYKITGESKEEILGDSIRAIFSTITDLSAIEAKDERTIKASGRDDRELLVNCLRGALSLFNDEDFIARDCQVTILEPNAGLPSIVEARLVGERFDLSKHPYRTEIKGVTYHAAEILRGPGGWEANFTLDL